MRIPASPTGRPPRASAGLFYRGPTEARFSNKLNSTLLHDVQTAAPANVHRDRIAFEHDSTLAQGSWLRLSTNSRQVFYYEESRQYIQLHHPEVVVKAIPEVLNAIAGSHAV